MNPVDIAIAVVGLAIPFLIGIAAWYNGHRKGYHAAQEAAIVKTEARIKATRIIDKEASQDTEALDDLRAVAIPTDEDLDKLHGVIERLRITSGDDK